MAPQSRQPWSPLPSPRLLRSALPRMLRSVQGGSRNGTICHSRRHEPECWPAPWRPRKSLDSSRLLSSRSFIFYSKTEVWSHYSSARHHLWIPILFERKWKVPALPRFSNDVAEEAGARWVGPHWPRWSTCTSLRAQQECNWRVFRYRKDIIWLTLLTDHAGYKAENASEDTTIKAKVLFKNLGGKWRHVSTSSLPASTSSSGGDMQKHFKLNKSRWWAKVAAYYVESTYYQEWARGEIAEDEDVGSTTSPELNLF